MVQEDKEDNPLSKKVTIALTTQQYTVVDRVRNQATMGNSDSEIFRNVFLDWFERKQKGVNPISVIGHDRDNS